MLTPLVIISHSDKKKKKTHTQKNPDQSLLINNISLKSLFFFFLNLFLFWQCCFTNPILITALKHFFK